MHLFSTPCKQIFWHFQVVEKGWIGNKWINLASFWVRKHGICILLKKSWLLRDETQVRTEPRFGMRSWHKLELKNESNTTEKQNTQMQIDVNWRNWDKD